MKKLNGQKSLWLAAWRMSRLPPWLDYGPETYGDPARAVTTRRHLDLAEKQRRATSDPMNRPPWWKDSPGLRALKTALIRHFRGLQHRSPPLPLP